MKRFNWRWLLLFLCIAPMSMGFTIVDKNTGKVKDLGLKCPGPTEPAPVPDPPNPPPEDPHPPKE
jgi:hypothetical protein